jgi:hypothetical protein
MNQAMRITGAWLFLAALIFCMAEVLVLGSAQAQNRFDKGGLPAPGGGLRGMPTPGGPLPGLPKMPSSPPSQMPDGPTMPSPGIRVPNQPNLLWNLNTLHYHCSKCQESIIPQDGKLPTRCPYCHARFCNVPGGGKLNARSAVAGMIIGSALTCGGVGLAIVSAHLAGKPRRRRRLRPEDYV